jgi:hypothetical protein
VLKVDSLTAFTRDGSALCLLKGTPECDVYVGAHSPYELMRAQRELGCEWTWTTLDE